jgi:hypothetical protein
MGVSLNLRTEIVAVGNVPTTRKSTLPIPLDTATCFSVPLPAAGKDKVAGPGHLNFFFFTVILLRYGAILKVTLDPQVREQAFPQILSKL